MDQTFTTTLNSTNRFEMKEQEAIENMGPEEIVFYNSICADLDQIEQNPKLSTIQNILSHSQNYVS